VGSRMVKAIVLVGALTFVGVFGSTFISSASAQDTSDGKDIKGNIAGTIGLGLIGAELGLVLVPACKLQNQVWAWVVFPTVLAGGGAVAGALAFDPGSPQPAVTLSLLGAGFLLAVPAIVGAVALRDKRNNAPPEALQEGGVLRFGGRQRFGVPTVGAAPVYTQAERTRLGLPQRTMVSVALVSGRF
jgi:peptidoglycan/LPS O-acetylase OafA/YrhL